MSSTAIDSKKEEKNNSSVSQDWVGFGKDIFKYFIMVLVWILIGANLVYFSKLNLEVFFPTDETCTPYANKICELRGDKSSDNINYVLNKCGLRSYGFPYTGLNNGELYGLYNFFSSGAAYSYTSGRHILQTILNFFNEEEVLVMASAPFIIMLLCLVQPIFTIISTIIGQFKSYHGIFWSIILFWVILFWPVGLSLVQHIQLIVTLLFIPPMVNFNFIKKTIASYSRSASIIFGILVIVSAFKHLGTTIALSMGAALTIMIAVGSI